MSTPNARVLGMIACSSGIRGSCHGNPDDIARTYGMIACASGNISSCPGSLTNNMSYSRGISHSNPADSAITAGVGKYKTVYVGNKLYPISIVQLE